jgi:hypothetical protein
VLKIVHFNGAYGADRVEYDGGAADNTVRAGAALDGHVFDVYDDSDTIFTLPEPLAVDSLGYTEYPCEIIDPHHGRCVIPDYRGAIDRLGSIPGTGSTFPVESTLAPVMLAVGLDEGTNSFAAITDSGPYSASVTGGTGDDRIWLPKGPWSFATVSSGRNYIRAARNTAPIKSEMDNGLYGYDGPDEIYALNGSYNDVICGDNVDTVVADEIDRVASDCESVERH